MTRTNLRERLIYGGSYTGFFLFSFLVSAYFTFPYDRLRDLISDAVSKAGSGGTTYSLKMGDLAPSWITGVKIDDVDLTSTSEGDPAPHTVHLDRVTLRASPLSFLLGTLKGSASADIGKGSIAVNYAQANTEQQIDAELGAVDVQSLGLGGFVGVPLKGTAGGTVNLVLDQDPAKSTGDIALKIVDLHIGDGKAKVKIPGMGSGLTLEEIDAGDLDLGINVHEGLAELERFNSNGHDLKVDGTGSIALATPLSRSRPDVPLELKFSDAFKNKNDHTKALFELLGMQPDWRRATSADGAIHMHLGGSFQGLRVSPASGSARAVRPTARKRAPGGADKTKPGAAP
jgi:type II secretion system protein N